MHDPVRASQKFELYQAASLGNIPKTLALLECLGDVNALAMSSDGSRNVSALLIASEKGHHELVRRLIGKGANVNFLSDMKESSLLNACIFGHDKVVEELLVGGANPNQVAGYPTPALPVAVAYTTGKLPTELICRLLGVSNKPNPVFGGSSMLYLASQRGDLEVVKCLLARNARIRDTHLDTATEHNQVHVLKLFFEKNIPDDILMNGARLEKTRDMFLLILQGEVNAPDQDYFKKVMRDTSSAFRKVYDWISDTEPCILENLFPYFLDKSTTSSAGRIEVFRGGPSGDWTYATPFKSQAAGASAGVEMPHKPIEP